MNFALEFSCFTAIILSKVSLTSGEYFCVYSHSDPSQPIRKTHHSPISFNYCMVPSVISVYIIWLAEKITRACNIGVCNIIQIWTGYEGNSTKYMPEGVWVDNYFTRP